jgi:hypothetical protein
MEIASSFRDRYGQWALVAGGSEGIGAAFAEQIAARGLNLLLVARRAGPLEKTAARLRGQTAVEIRTMSLDLGSTAALTETTRVARRLEVGLLVYNAASSYEGPYFGTDLAKYRHVIDTNCFGAIALIDAATRPMLKRGRGGIIVMSSMAAFQGSPYVTVYSATKAFLLTLAEGLAVEMKPKGIDVLVCCPAVVRTPNYLASRPQGAKATAVDVEPDLVAREALQTLGRRSVLVPGAKARMAHLVMRLMPRSAAVTIMAHSTRTMYGEK